MVRVKTPAENEVGGSRTPPIKVQTDLTSLEVITGVATHFRRKKISTFV
jgi:hypothetical protein